MNEDEKATLRAILARMRIEISNGDVAAVAVLASAYNSVMEAAVMSMSALQCTGA